MINTSTPASYFEDKVLFRVSLLNEGTMDQMQRIEPRRYAVSPRLTGEVHRCLAQKAFEGAAAPLTMACLELRDEAALDQWLVLRGGIRLERFWVDWTTDYLHAHGRAERD